MNRLELLRDWCARVEDDARDAGATDWSLSRWAPELWELACVATPVRTLTPPPPSALCVLGRVWPQGLGVGAPGAWELWSEDGPTVPLGTEVETILRVRAATFAEARRAVLALARERGIEVLG